MDLCNQKDIRELLARHGFNFSKSLGQNFLVQAWVPERIARESGISGKYGVLEIGPGIGCLTVQLAKLAKKVVSVELDKALLPVLSETLSELDNTEVVHGDILKTSIKELADQRLWGMPLAVCANLPYNITTPVITKLIDAGSFESITVMVQREVARRMCARPGTPEYGAFTVYTKFHTRPEILFDVPPDCFIPRPKVYSSVIRLGKRTGPPADIADETLFFRVVKAAFGQRRKTLVNCLHSAFGKALSKERLINLVERCGFDSRIRGESLGIPEFANISNALSAMLKDN